MNVISRSLIVSLVLSCGGRVTASTEVGTVREPVATYVVGQCTGVQGPLCGYSLSEYLSSRCCAPSAEMRSYANTFTVYDDCTVVESVGIGPDRPALMQSWRLTADGCTWSKSAVTKDLLAAIDSPTTCTASPLGTAAVTVRDAQGRDHHKELVAHCADPTLAWFRSAFGVNCIYSHQ